MEMTQEEMDLRFGHRRRMAKWAFRVGIVGGPALIALALLSDTMAARVGEIEWLIGIVVGFITTVLTWYYTATSYEQARMNK